MKIVFTVVKEGKELLFRAPPGLLFDRLQAYGIFVGGGLSIVRRSKPFDATDATTAIEEYGTHAACICFCGFKHLYPNTWGVTSCIDAEELKKGDRVTVRFPPGTPRKLNLEEALWQDLRGQRALLKVTPPVGKTITLGQLMKQYHQQLTRETEKRPHTLRFKR